jgi:hypothetical protein
MRLQAGIYHFIPHFDGDYAIPGGGRATREAINLWAHQMGLIVVEFML